MTVKIQQVGIFKTQCSRCKSVFTYEFTDCKGVRSDGVEEFRVTCPNCSTYVKHDGKFFYRHEPKAGT